jgi:hypothetical protein
MLHAFAIEPSGQIFRNITRSIAAQKPRPVRNGDVIKARRRKRLVERGRDVGGALGETSLSRVRSATTSLRAVASRQRSFSPDVAARAVLPANRRLPASRNSLDQP